VGQRDHMVDATERSALTCSLSNVQICQSPTETERGKGEIQATVFKHRSTI